MVYHMIFPFFCAKHVNDECFQHGTTHSPDPLSIAFAFVVPTNGLCLFLHDSVCVHEFTAIVRTNFYKNSFQLYTKCCSYISLNYFKVKHGINELGGFYLDRSVSSARTGWENP